MRTATGNIILIRLAASSIEDGTVNGEALEAVYDTYNYDFPGITRKIYDFIRMCGITKISKKTLRLAEIAIDYFDKTERKKEMEDYKKLYIPCPVCDDLMEYHSENDDDRTVTYSCKNCDVAITLQKVWASEYTSAEAYSRAVYDEFDPNAPTPEEEEAYYAAVGHEELGMEVEDE